MEWQRYLTVDYLPLTLAVWLVLLSIFQIRTVAENRRLKRLKSASLGQSSPFSNANQMDEIIKKLEKVDNLQKDSIQKYALIRFNPFEDTGGDQSFAVALLDSQNNGIVISSLHSRGGTRVYAKQVVSAKATTHQFSKEEKEVVEKAAHHA